MNWIFGGNPDMRSFPFPGRFGGNGEETLYGKTKKEKPMALKREARLTQKAAWEVKLQKQVALLTGKGRDEKQIARDVLVKELKAKIKKSQVRLRAIDANEKRTAELAAIKAERLARPKEEPPKAKKAAPEPPPEAKAKKKKKKEDDTTPQQA
jgi:hypothetical protein